MGPTRDAPSALVAFPKNACDETTLAFLSFLAESISRLADHAETDIA